ncbi:isochorismate synthase MenF [Streptomyces sp. CBMA152]|uniref:isochorismate synthase n=1 Tax=Streptomyces sp. CBMA152 TaxID=1896312 RepID=UPI0016615AE0|nr:isochorismate synthase [Streptomyces sp. CBMA152]
MNLTDRRERPQRTFGSPTGVVVSSLSDAARAAIRFTDGQRIFFSSPDLSLLGIEPVAEYSVRPGDDISELLRDGDGIGFVAFPFRRSEAVRIAVPERTLRLDRNCDHRALLASLGPPPETDEAPRSYALRPIEEPDEWCGSVADVAGAVRRGELHKAVLARRVEVTSDVVIQPPQVLGRLAQSFPGSYLFSAFGLVGASPELLLSKRGRYVESKALAGTARRGGDETADRELARWLTQSPKNQQEHRILRDMVLETLAPYAVSVQVSKEPEILKLTNVQHLMTRLTVELKPDHPPFLELANSLHPTPAVCGWPREAAYAVIDQVEDWDRGLYGGALGWVDAQDNGCLCVTIRCAELKGMNATVFAGSGIVADSDPDEELAETRAKLGALLPALIAP